MAASAGLMVDGLKLHAFLLELSHVMEEAIAKDDPNDRLAAYEPGGAHHVAFANASEATRDRRWSRWVPFVGRARRSVGQADHSALMGTGVAHALNPKGHGADARRKLGIEPKQFLASLLADEGARERLKRAIAAVERGTDHVAACVTRKRLVHATYDMIDAYRDLFLVKHPSRGAMLAQTKRLVAYLYANVMAAGESWAEGDELEELRLRATRGAAAEAEAAEVAERTDNIYRAFCKEVSKEAVAEARRRDLGGKRWMKVAREWWKNSERNPKRARPAQPNAEMDDGGEQTGADSDGTDAYGAQGDGAPGDNGDAEPMEVEDPEPEPEITPTCAPNDENASLQWQLGGLVGVMIKRLRPPLSTCRGENGTSAGHEGTRGRRKRNLDAAPMGPPERQDKVTLAFITEILKTKAHHTHDHGTFGPNAFAKVLEECRKRDVREAGPSRYG
jgi:hypothetical protein